MTGQTKQAPDNPYAAPQADLRLLPSHAAEATKYLRQGIVAGLQMGGFGAFVAIVVYVASWHASSSVSTLVIIPVLILFFCTLVGLLIGLAVQGIVLLFGVRPSDSLLPSLPVPSLGSSEYNAREERDRSSHYPPPPLT